MTEPSKRNGIIKLDNCTNWYVNNQEWEKRQVYVSFEFDDELGWGDGLDIELLMVINGYSGERLAWKSKNFWTEKFWTFCLEKSSQKFEKCSNEINQVCRDFRDFHCFCFSHGSLNQVLVVNWKKLWKYENFLSSKALQNVSRDSWLVYWSFWICISNVNLQLLTFTPTWLVLMKNSNKALSKEKIQ